MLIFLISSSHQNKSENTVIFFVSIENILKHIIVVGLILLFELEIDRSKCIKIKAIESFSKQFALRVKLFKNYKKIKNAPNLATFVKTSTFIFC
jgi:hypothetical protein